MERKIKHWIKKNVMKIALFAIIILGIVVRISLRKFVSGDAKGFLIPWYKTIKSNGGLKGLGTQVGNYNILYQFFIALFTYIPLNPLTVYKGFSSIFDFALAALGVAYVKKVWKAEYWKEFMAFTCIFLSPVAILNSALWAQCDSIYSFFCIAVLLFLFKEQYWMAMIFLGIAFSFKMQAIFILPFVLLYYIVNEKFSIKCFGGTIISMIVLALPGVFCRRSVLDIVYIYKGQIQESSDWSFYNYPGFSNLFTNPESAIEHVRYTKSLCYIIAIAVIGCLCAWVIYKKIEMTRYNYTYLAFLVTYAGILFMPAMHERYGFIYEILAILIAVYDMKTIAGCLALQLCSIITYSYYLFKFEYNIRALSIFNMVIFIGYLLYFIRKLKQDDNIKEKSANFTCGNL